jgi:glycosyltransferase involved in cell wall biosynthesis
MQVIVCSSDYLPNIGGVAAHVHELARALQRAGDTVRVLTVHPGGWYQPGTWSLRHSVQDGVNAVSLPLASGPGGKGRFARLRRFARRLPAVCGLEPGPYILHVHDCDYGSYLAEFAPGPVTRVFTNHTSGFLQDLEAHTVPDDWVRRFRLYDQVIAPSQELADGAIQCGVSDGRATFIPNGVDPDRFKPDPELRREVRAELKIPDDEVVVLCARRFVAKNGVIDFAHSLRSLSPVSRTTILFAGNAYGTPDLYEKETIGAVKRSPLGAKAVFLGPVPNATMHRLYAAADIGVLPSLKEATSITGLESMACGLPLVGTRVGGIPDLIDHERTGLLVEYGNPQAFGTAVRRLIVDRELRETFGRNARQKVLNQFTWARVADITRELYQSVAGRGRNAAEACEHHPDVVGAL